MIIGITHILCYLSNIAPWNFIGFSTIVYLVEDVPKIDQTPEAFPRPLFKLTPGYPG